MTHPLPQNRQSFRGGLRISSGVLRKLAHYPTTAGEVPAQAFRRWSSERRSLYFSTSGRVMLRQPRQEVTRSYIQIRSFSEF